MPDGRLLVLIGEAGELSGALLAALTEEGFRVRQIIHGGAVRRESADRFAVDFSSPNALRALHTQLGGPVGGILNCLGLCHTGDDPAVIAAWTFNVVKEFADDLRASAAAGGSWFVNLTALGGQFGLGGDRPASLAAAGTLGITKTLGREVPDLHARNIDVDPTLPADLLSARLLQEILEADDDFIEVGLTRDGRWRPALKAAPVPSNLPPLALDPGALILVTGGASGVTADVARGLAGLIKPRLILVGRSPEPKPESPETRGLDRAALRKMLLNDARRRDQTILPAVIEPKVNRILKDREIRANLDACRAAGAVVEYHALDVRDARRFGVLIDDVYSRHGRIDGVVHGAGVIEDRRIADKTPESFDRVFGTKVDGALTLARKLRPDRLRFLVFFGSVSGRFGNVGQADYAAANEVLNKLADDLAARWPARVVCINWGPWDGGMVTPQLRQMYSAKNIGLIPIEQGIQAFRDEIRLTDRGCAEVVVSCSVEQMQLPTSLALAARV